MDQISKKVIYCLYRNLDFLDRNLDLDGILIFWIEILIIWMKSLLSWWVLWYRGTSSFKRVERLTQFNKTVTYLLVQKLHECVKYKQFFLLYINIDFWLLSLHLLNGNLDLLDRNLELLDRNIEIFDRNLDFIISNLYYLDEILIYLLLLWWFKNGLLCLKETLIY